MLKLRLKINSDSSLGGAGMQEIVVVVIEMEVHPI
jgi:hypothetical protein